MNQLLKRGGRLAALAKRSGSRHDGQGGPSMSIILGIDPGSRITGYGVIRIVAGKAEYLGSGCIRTDLGELPSRLKQVYDGVSGSSPSSSRTSSPSSGSLWHATPIRP